MHGNSYAKVVTKGERDNANNTPTVQRKLETLVCSKSQKFNSLHFNCMLTKADPMDDPMTLAQRWKKSVTPIQRYKAWKYNF